VLVRSSIINLTSNFDLLYSEGRLDSGTLEYCCWCIQHLTVSAGVGKQGQSIQPRKKKYVQSEACSEELFAKMHFEIESGYNFLSIMNCNSGNVGMGHEIIHLKTTHNFPR